MRRRRSGHLHGEGGHGSLCNTVQRGRNCRSLPKPLSSGQAAMSLPPKPGPSSPQLLPSRSLGPLETQALGNILTSMNSSPRMYQVLFVKLPVPRNREAGGPPRDSVTKGVVEGRRAWAGMAEEIAEASKWGTPGWD